MLIPKCLCRVRPFILTVLSQFIMLSSGTLYLFPVYSPTLKKNLNLTQEDTNFVGSAAHFGAFFSVFGGMFFDAFGSRATLLLGGSFKLVGYLMMAGTIEGWLPGNHLFAAASAYVFGTGCSTSLTAVLGANYASFKDHSMHGRLVGLLTAFFGLSSGCLSLVFDVFFTSPVSFIYFLAFFAGGVDVCSAFFVGHPNNLALPTAPDSLLNTKGNRVGTGAYPLGRGGIIGLGIPVNQFTSGIFSTTANTYTRFTRGLTMCALTAVHVVVSAALLHVSGGSAATAVGCLAVLVVLLVMQSTVLLRGTGQFVFERSEMEPVDVQVQLAAKAAQDGVGPRALLSLVDFWLLFLSLMFSMGAGVTVVNNLSQMVSAFPALAPTAGVVSHSLLKLLACTNTLGRLASGLLSDRLAARVSRTTFTVYCVAGMALGQVILSSVGESAPLFGLSCGVFVVGWMFGSLFWAIPTLTMELFGAKHFGVNRGLVGLSPAVGGYVMSTLLAGKVYAANSSGEHNNCVAGGACYRAAWVTNAVLVVVAVGMSASLAFRCDASRRTKKWIRRNLARGGL
jgi:MFS family permease